MTTDPHEKRTYRPERLPQAAERSLGEGSLRAALAVARGVHEAVAAVSFLEPQIADERWEIAHQLHPLEVEHLATWAETHQALLNTDEFTARWERYDECNVTTYFCC